MFTLKQKPYLFHTACSQMSCWRKRKPQSEIGSLQEACGSHGRSLLWGHIQAQSTASPSTTLSSGCRSIWNFSAYWSKPWPCPSTLANAHACVSTYTCPRVHSLQRNQGTPKKHQILRKRRKRERWANRGVGNRRQCAGKVTHKS